jgi:hypothetical protein
MGILLAVLLEFCFITPKPPLLGGYLVTGSAAPGCSVVSSVTGLPVAGCKYLGGVIGGCNELPKGVNWLYNVESVPNPGEVYFIRFVQ